jgi:DUF438 domain-containing protein
MDYHELEKNTVAKLREMAKEQLPDLKGLSGMRKEKLVDLLAEKMGIEKPHRVVVGVDKPAIKAQIRALKKTQAQAIQAKDREKIRATRHDLHRLRRQLRKAAKVVA